MWETWLFWILIGGLILFMFRRGGCCGHGRHGDSQGHGGPGKEGMESNTNRKDAHGGCH